MPQLRWTFLPAGDVFVVYNHEVPSLLDRWQLDSNQFLIKLQYAFRQGVGFDGSVLWFALGVGVWLQLSRIVRAAWAGFGPGPVCGPSATGCPD